MPTFERVIQLELNELSIDIIQELCSEGLLPNFKYILCNWQYIQTTSEEKYELIEPWIQWVTVHTGKEYAEHQIFRLGDLNNLKHEQIWETLSRYNVECCIIASMNAKRGNMDKGLFLPDPWGKLKDVLPGYLQPLWQFIQFGVKNHDQKITLFRYLKILVHIVRLDLSIVFLTRLAYQIVFHKINRQSKWKLAAWFDLFLFNVFKQQLGKPYRFYTLFLNSVAHYQHHYWRKYNKEIFDDTIQCPQIRKDDDPIRYGYQMYDDILGEVIKSANEKTLVTIVSGLTQEPYIADEERGGLYYFRLKNHQHFLQSLGIEYEDIKPLMSRDWIAYFKNVNDADYYTSVLKNLTINNVPLFNIKEHAQTSIFVETQFASWVDKEALIFDQVRNQTFSFSNHFILTAVKSGHHNGNGVFFSSAKVFPEDATTRYPLSKIYDLTLDNFLNSQQ